MIPIKFNFNIFKNEQLIYKRKKALSDLLVNHSETAFAKRLIPGNCEVGGGHK